jgi:alpha-L-fucosidase
MGAGYLVLTSKHHDGFCLWHSRHTEYDIASAPFERDVMDELARACHREGVVFCTYHSICDWRHPDYPQGSPGGKTSKPDANMQRYRTYLHDQVTEIIQNYGPIGIMWFDGEWEEPWTESMGRELYDLCRRLQPDILVNNRVGKGRQGMSGTTRSGQFAGDYDTPEQEVGKYQVDRPWESCITLCNQWAWKPEDPMKPLPDLIKTLVNCVGGDGNLLLNVGPMPTGEVEPRQTQRLRELGQWLKANGRSVYGTRGGPLRPGSWGASTHSGSSVFLHVLNWQGSDRLQLPTLNSEILSAKTLQGRPVYFYRSSGTLEILRPADTKDEIDTVIELVMAEEISIP